MTAQPLMLTASAATDCGLSLDQVSLRIPLSGTPRRWVYAASDLSLDVRLGQITAIVGESGCGKSVLALAVLGLLPTGTQTSGSIWFGDLDLLAAGESTLRAVRGIDLGLIPQSAATHLTPVRTIASTLGETLRFHRMPASDDDIEDLLDGVGLPPGTATRYPHELSGGMAQRVLVAATLALQPGVLVADEPTSALDPETTELVLNSLAAHAESGNAVVLITHDLLAARRVAHRTAVMYAGRLLEVGPADVVLQDPAHDYTRALLAALPHNGFHPPPGVPSSLVDPDPARCAWHTRVGRECSGAPLSAVDGGDHLVACSSAEAD